MDLTTAIVETMLEKIRLRMRIDQIDAEIEALNEYQEAINAEL